jgi:outer membrane protein OmpA-like peptidoglycan-associated protein
MLVQVPTGVAAKRLLGLGCLIFLWSLTDATGLWAVDWPWKKLPADDVTARCTLDRDQIEVGSQAPLHAKAEASDSRKHLLAYVWSGNGGKISGVGPEVQVDTAGLNPGVYGVEVLAQDAYQHKATCTVHFTVLFPPDSVGLSCNAAPSAVEEGTEARLAAQGTDALGHPLRYSWFTNGGKVKGEGPLASLDTSGLSPGLYTVTGRVEDGLGGASDCAATVQVNLRSPPPEPPAPPQPSNIAEIVFPRNRDTLLANVQALLQKVLGRLRADASGRVSIESYAGPDESNPQQLAAARAEMVKRYLLENGVSEGRVRTMVGLGGRRGGLRNRTLDIIWLPEGLDY